MDLLITLPQKVNWTDYQKELDAVAADPKGVLNFRVPSLPTRSAIGARCYITHKGLIVGWMEICGLRYRNGFTCDVSGATWQAGFYVQRKGRFHKLKQPISYKGFQGYRYFDPTKWGAL